MWALVVVFLASNGGFSIPGYTSAERCNSGGFEIFKQMTIEASKQGTGAPKLFTFCAQVN